MKWPIDYRGQLSMGLVDVTRLRLKWLLDSSCSRFVSLSARPTVAWLSKTENPLGLVTWNYIRSLLLSRWCIVLCEMLLGIIIFFSAFSSLLIFYLYSFTALLYLYIHTIYFSILSPVFVSFSFSACNTEGKERYKKRKLVRKMLERSPQCGSFPSWVFSYGQFGW